MTICGQIARAKAATDLRIFMCSGSLGFFFATHGLLFLFNHQPLDSSPDSLCSSGPSDTASHTTPKMSATAGSTLTYLPPSRKNPMEPSRRFWQPEQSRQNCIRARSCVACASPTRFRRRQTSPSRKLTPSKKSTSAIGKGKN